MRNEKKKQNLQRSSIDIGPQNNFGDNVNIGCGNKIEITNKVVQEEVPSSIGFIEKIVRWYSGLVCLAGALISSEFGNYDIVISLIIALIVLIPPISNYIENKLGITIPKSLRFFIVFILISPILGRIIEGL